MKCARELRRGVFGRISPLNSAGMVMPGLSVAVAATSFFQTVYDIHADDGGGEQVFGPKGPFCQSCGMPVSKDEKGGGTEGNGSKSTDYCSHCYRMGQFIDPNLTAEEVV